ncbi:hypothetical protein IT400_03770 [Candidatus Nomurabacteria bacterium]|nr:hypothetical protein [Candidatus Nomurabacteria bacterium]
MNSETRNCQNCKKDFNIDPDDFAFYSKLNVPAPTFCNICRMQRRFMFRNERTLYKRNCDLCKNSTISIFSPDKQSKVYCSKCWWGDDWDTGDYYLDYDPNKNFFEQMKELQTKAPFMDKVSSFLTLENSDYVNHSAYCKNCYMITTADYCENVYHSNILLNVKDSCDVTMVGPAELLYGSIGGGGSSRAFFSKNCTKSINVWYSKDCVGCNDCFGCVNLRKKSHHIYNEPYSKEEYDKKIKEMELDKYSSHKKIREHIYDFWNKFPYRYVHGRMNTNVTGDYIVNAKNAKQCYRCQLIEDSAYCQFITMSTFKDNYDVSEWGNGVELCIDTVTVGEGANKIKYSSAVWNNVQDVEYSMYVINCSNCFGCVNLKKKQYCILNKQYTKEEYFKLREQIISDLEKNPYVDSKGRIWKYGEFMPYDLAPFAYNESFAQEYFPLTTEHILENGFKYIEPKKLDYKETVMLDDIPDSIYDIQDEFVKEIIKCNCGKFYKIVAGELQLLKRFGIPVPRQCPDCRHMFRMNLLNKPYLYERQCDKCGKDVQSSFAPDRPEIIYCESCYQQEVM